jgi:hypothetical protein
MVTTRQRRAEEQQEQEEKAQDALNWRKYYTQHSFKYNRGRLVKRIMAKKRVLLKTLKKYQLVKFYKENTTTENKKYLKQEEDFLGALERFPVPRYVNETVNTVANDMKNMLIGNTDSAMINPEKIDVRVNVRCPSGGVEEQQDNVIDGDIVDDFQEDFDDGMEEAKTDDLDIDDDDMDLGLGDDDMDIDDVFESLPPTPPPAKKKKRAPQSKYVPYTLADGLKDIANGKKLNGAKLAKGTVTKNQETLGRIVELLGCKDDIAACLKQTRNMERLQYKIKDGKKVLRDNKNKQAYGVIKALITRYSPRLNKMLGETVVERWTNEFDAIMDWWRKKDKKKRTVTAALDWTKILKVLPLRKKEFDEAKKKYLRIKKEVEKNKDKKRASVLKQALQTAANNFNRANMLYLVVALYTLQPSRRLNAYNKMLVVDTIPVRNTVGKKGLQYLIKDPVTGEIQSYYGVKNSVFVFQDYKTNDKYFQQRFALNRRQLPSALGSYGKLRNIINESLNDYVTKDGERRKWLIVNPNTNRPYKTMENLYQAAFRTPELIEANDGENVTANTLRHSFITYQTLEKNLTAPELKQLALLMLHSEQTQKESYLQLLTPYISPEFS